MIRKTPWLVLVAAAFSAAGCVYLKNGTGQAISLRTYDCLRLDSVEADPSVAEGWVAPALAEALQGRLERGREWKTPGAGLASRDLKLRVRLTGAHLPTPAEPCEGRAHCRASCHLTVYDARSGQALGSASVPATCAGPAACAGGKCPRPTGQAAQDHYRQAVVTRLADEILTVLRRSKQCSRNWESGVMGCGC